MKELKIMIFCIKFQSFLFQNNVMLFAIANPHPHSHFTAIQNKMETSSIHENKENNTETAGLEVVNDSHSHDESVEENNEDNAPTPMPTSNNAPMLPVSNNSPIPVSNNAPIPVPVSTPRENYPLNEQQKAPIYLMVDPSQIPNMKGQHIQLFNLHDGVRQIVGYCLPLKHCVELFKYIQPARVIKLTETNNSQFHEQLSTKFKFNSTPLCVAPMNEKEYHEMMKSPPVPSRNWPFMRNRFFVRQFSPNSQKGVFSPNSQKGVQLFDDSAMNFVMEKFKLHTNPHLIPFRLHDGLDCFIRLELALHCQQGAEIIDCNLRSPTPYLQYICAEHSEELESAVRKNAANGGQQKHKPSTSSPSP